MAEDADTAAARIYANPTMSAADKMAAIQAVYDAQSGGNSVNALGQPVNDPFSGWNSGANYGGMKLTSASGQTYVPPAATQGAPPPPVAAAPAPAPEPNMSVAPTQSVDPGAALASGVDKVFAPYAPPPAPTSLVPPGTQPAPMAPPAPARGGGRGGGAGGGTPAWLRSYMGQSGDTEGRVVQPPRLTVNPLTKEGRAALDEADTEGFQARQAQGEAEIQRHEDVAKALIHQADQQDAIDRQFAERQHARIQQLKGMEADYKSMADDIANTPITDPDFWGGADVGNQILGRVAMFLGTIGAGAAGSPNIVYEKMKGDVERGIKLQLENKALKQNRLAAQGTLYGMAADRFQSEAAIDQAMREGAYRKIGAELEAFKEQAQTPERRAALDALIAENNKQLTLEDENRRVIMDTSELNERIARQRAMAGPDPLAKLKAQQKLYAIGADIAKNKAAMEGGGAADILKERGAAGQLVKAAREASGQAAAMREQLQKYTEAQLQYKKNPSLDTRQLAEARAQEMQVSFQKAYLPGSDQGSKIAQEMFPMGGPDTLEATIKARAQAAEERIKRDEDAALRAAQGLPGVPESTSFTPKTEKGKP